MASSGMAKRNVSRIFAKFLARLMSLSTLRMRKVLTTVVKAPLSVFNIRTDIIPKNALHTIEKSKRFHPS